MTFFQTERFVSSPTHVLILANVSVFVLLFVGGEVMYDFLAQIGALFFRAHFYWQLFTSMFVHFGISHLLFNMFGLYYFGRLNERYFSAPRFLVIYLGSGLLGNVASLFLVPPNIATGGASGAIFGMVGSYVAIARKAQDMGAAAIYALLIFIQSSFMPGVNLFAHLFGLLGGLALGLAFLSTRRRIGYEFGYTMTT